jgi:hypothetical protein
MSDLDHVRCIHGRYRIDPCFSCGRRYEDGKLIGPFDVGINSCPTCGQQWAGDPDAPCDAIKPGTEHDVLPVRCTLLRADHPIGYHEHPPLWPGTGSVVWPTDA